MTHQHCSLRASGLTCSLAARFACRDAYDRATGHVSGVAAPSALRSAHDDGFDRGGGSPELEQAPQRRRSSAALIACGGMAAALRVPSLRWGLPYLFHPDEPTNFSIVQRMLKQHDLNPHFSNIRRSSSMRTRSWKPFTMRPVVCSASSIR